MFQGIYRHIAQQITEILYETLSFLHIRQFVFRYGFLYQPVHDKQIRRVHTERFRDQFQRLLGIFLLSKSHKIPIP